MTAHVRRMSGGAVGVRDGGPLESALAARRTDTPIKIDIAELAPTYAVDSAKNHPFVDGAKRVAFACLGQLQATTAPS